MVGMSINNEPFLQQLVVGDTSAFAPWFHGGESGLRRDWSGPHRKEPQMLMRAIILLKF
jgi:hypothetical protein